MKTTYHTIVQKAQSEFKDRGSRFIAYSFLVKDVVQVKIAVKKTKELHPKAVHHCLAFRVGYDGQQFRANDDGEPSGSAGKPILGQIDHADLTNVLIVVVRYFGGTLLGVPGLINAYKTVSHDVLQLSGRVEKNIEINFSLQFSYTLMNEVMRIIKQYQLELISSDMLLFCEYIIAVPLQIEKEVFEKFEAFHELKIVKL